MLHMGVHLQATCEQLEGKKRKNKETIRNPKISTCSSVAQTKKTWIVSGYFWFQKPKPTLWRTHGTKVLHYVWWVIESGVSGFMKMIQTYWFRLIYLKSGWFFLGLLVRLQFKICVSCFAAALKEVLRSSSGFKNCFAETCHEKNCFAAALKEVLCSSSSFEKCFAETFHEKNCFAAALKEVLRSSSGF